MAAAEGLRSSLEEDGQLGDHQVFQLLVLEDELQGVPCGHLVLKLAQEGAVEAEHAQRGGLPGSSTDGVPAGQGEL